MTKLEKFLKNMDNFNKNVKHGSYEKNLNNK